MDWSDLRDILNSIDNDEQCLKKPVRFFDMDVYHEADLQRSMTNGEMLLIPAMAEDDDGVD